MLTNEKAPWLKHYGDVKFNLDYPDGSMSEVVLEMAKENPSTNVLAFMGKKISHAKFIDKINETAKALSAIGIKEGDVVTICLPNIPQGVYSLYALNLIGAVASMIHPLSAPNEILNCLKLTHSKCLIALDQFSKKIESIKHEAGLDKIIYASVSTEIGKIKGAIYKKLAKIKKINEDQNTISWKTLIKNAASFSGDYKVNKKANDMAVILFSGGTTGVTKAIALSNLNFNALTKQTETMCNYPVKGNKMLAAMPIFHGFGLGVCIHTAIAAGGCSILVPRFDVKQYAKLIKKEKPNYIAGVPTLYEALVRSDYLKGTKLDFLLGVFSGGDSLSVSLNKRINEFLFSHGSKVGVREGYGTTECVTASCLTPYIGAKEGSIGLPYPDTYYKIVEVGTKNELPYGNEGEICLTGPSLMLGYLGNEKETKEALQTHADGKVWLHTGDLGTMDSDGFIYFKQRLKRIIITSGYNVYPSQIENTIDEHPAVHQSCVIGIKDDYKIQVVYAYIVLKKDYKPSDELKAEILSKISSSVAKYAMPKEIVFRDSLPKTLVGKIAYRVLEEQENAKITSK